MIFSTMLLSEKCASLIQIINTLSLFAGTITSIIGASMIPQTPSDNVFVGTSEEYNAKLRSLQLASYGFKVTMAGIILVGYAILGCGCIYGYRNVDCRNDTVQDMSAKVQQAPSHSEPKPLKSILKDTEITRLQININKWTGNLKPAIV